MIFLNYYSARKVLQNYQREFLVSFKDDDAALLTQGKKKDEEGR
jgi:hypothetical protein